MVWTPGFRRRQGYGGHASPRVTANVVVIAGLDSAWLYWPARLQCPYGHTTNGHTQASAVRATARQASRGMTRRREWGLGMMNAE